MQHTLSGDAVLEMYRLATTTDTKVAEIAKRYGVSPSKVYSIKSGRLWGCVTGAGEQKEGRRQYGKSAKVKELLAAGEYTNQQISDMLGVKYETVAYHRHVLGDKIPPAPKSRAALPPVVDLTRQFTMTPEQRHDAIWQVIVDHPEGITIIGIQHLTNESYSMVDSALMVFDNQGRYTQEDDDGRISVYQKVDLPLDVDGHSHRVGSSRWDMYGTIEAHSLGRYGRK